MSFIRLARFIDLPTYTPYAQLKIGIAIPISNRTRKGLTSMTSPHFAIIMNIINATIAASPKTPISKARERR
jgi:hypothetical protein